MAARSTSTGRVTPKGGGAVVRKGTNEHQRLQFRDSGAHHRQAFVSRAVARNTAHRGRR